MIIEVLCTIIYIVIFICIANTNNKVRVRLGLWSRLNLLVARYFCTRSRGRSTSLESIYRNKGDIVLKPKYPVLYIYFSDPTPFSRPFPASSTRRAAKQQQSSPGHHNSIALSYERISWRSKRQDKKILKIN